MRLRWMLPLGHGLIDAALFAFALFSEPQTNSAFPAGPFALVAQEPVTFNLRSLSYYSRPLTCALISSGSLPAGMLTSLWFPVLFLQPHELPWWFALHQLASLPMWFMLGWWQEEKKRVWVPLGKRYLALCGLAALAAPLGLLGLLFSLVQIGWWIAAFFITAAAGRPRLSRVS